MKQKVLLPTLILFGLSISNTENLNAQFNPTILGGNWVGRTDANITTIGIGNFTTSPLAALHVNSSLLSPSTAFGAGNLFRTDGLSTNLNQWQLFTGGTEKFRLSVPASGSNVNLNVFQSANMLFSTGNLERMRLTETGVLGIGTTNPDVASRMSVNGSYRYMGSSTGTVMYGLTNSTGIPNGDGFRIKVTENGAFFNGDALIFEKTDGNNDTPDNDAGTIAFTNTGQNGVETPSFYIRGSGRTYVGKNILSQTQLFNRFVIDSDPSDATPSGLRFVDLTASATPVLNPGSGVLAVDTDGNVIYVDGTNGGFGNNCSAPTSNPLTDNYKIPMNDFNIYFENTNTLGQNHVGVGYDCSSNLPGKISATQAHPLAITTSGTETIAGYFRNRDESETFFTQFVGVRGEADGPNMNDGSRNVGGYFSANNGLESVGVAGQGLGGKYSIGVYGEATGGGISNFGVYGTASGTFAWAGWFDGPGFLGAGAWTYSDHNLKHNIQEFQEANSILSQLNPVRYDFKTAEFPQLNLSPTPQIGLLAQELEQVLPDAVRDAKSLEKYDSLGNVVEESVTFKAVSYEKLIPVLVGGHQEQQAVIQQLQAENTDLRAQLNALNDRFNL